MKYYLIKITFALMPVVSIFFLMTNCKKKVIEKEVYIHDTLKYSWKEKKLSDANFYQIYSARGHLILLGADYYLYDLDSLNPTSIGVVPINSFLYGKYLPINNKACFLINNKGVNVYQTTNIGTYISPYINLSYYDTSFTNVYNYNALLAPLFNQNAVNDSCHLLIYGYDTSSANYGNFYYIKGKFNELSSTAATYSIQSFKKILYGQQSPYSAAFPPSVKSIGYNFLFSNDDTLYLLKPDYSIKKLNLYGILISTFNYLGCIYAYADYGSLSVLYKSCDNGENWNLEFYIYGGLMDGIVCLNNNIIGYDDDKLFLITINNTQISFKQLKNDGIEGKKIRGVALWNGNIYVATNGGLFYKPFNDFINDK